MDSQTDIKIPYELLTKEQQEEICNGCGGKGGWIKPPLKVFFFASCNHHDYGYWCGVTEGDRKGCDAGLLVSMTDDCTSLPWYKFILYYPWCLLYYIGVRKVGDNFFYYGKKKRYPAPTQDQLNRINEMALGIYKNV